MEPLVSICCIAYNHEKYIRQALDGFMMQNSDFDFEIIVHDDASKDNTADIIKEYATNFPDIIKPIYQTENQHEKRVGILQTFVFPRAKGKYIAMCEGDDYWTDPLKLQKQVDFLEENPDYSICFHLVENFFQDGNKQSFIYPQQSIRKPTFTINDLLEDNFMNTCSVVYRKQTIVLPDWFKKYVLGDYQMHLLYATYGKIGMLTEMMARYRIHAGGVWSANQNKDIAGKIQNRIGLLNDFDKYTKSEYSLVINAVLLKYKVKLVKAFLRENNNTEAYALFKEIRHFCSYRDIIDIFYVTIYFNLSRLLKIFKRLLKINKH